MDLEQRKKIYTQAKCLWGIGPQVDMMIEESSELTQALLKFRRDPSPERAIDVVQELADVEIMLEQMKMQFDRFNNNVETFKNAKIDRLKKRIQTSIKKNNGKQLTSRV